MLGQKKDYAFWPRSWQKAKQNVQQNESPSVWRHPLPSAYKLVFLARSFGLLFNELQPLTHPSSNAILISVVFLHLVLVIREHINIKYIDLHMLGDLE